MNINDTVLLANGVEMPRLGLGVYKVQQQETIQPVKWAITTGYRSIDTAAFYNNETEIGQAIKECGVAKKELFITTKVWNSNQGYEATLAAFDRSLNNLQLDSIDLYLIHWPVKELFKETWRALETLYQNKQVRAIGVCNFQPHHLDELLTDANVVPMVNQVELHPYLTQQPLRNYCAQHKIVVEAWSPLGRGKLLNDPLLMKLGQKHHKSPAQIILRWDLQLGIVTIPKSVKQSRIIENMSLYDFELSEAEMEMISNLNRDERTGSDPDNFDFSGYLFS